MRFLSVVALMTMFLTLPAHAENLRCIKADMVGDWQQLRVFVLDGQPGDWTIYQQPHVLWQFNDDKGFRVSVLPAPASQNDVKKLASSPMGMSYEMTGEGKFKLMSPKVPNQRQFECVKAGEDSDDYKAGDLILRDFGFGDEPYAFVLLRKIKPVLPAANPQ
jgi:hypothetical protein